MPQTRGQPLCRGLSWHLRHRAGSPAGIQEESVLHRGQHVPGTDTYWQDLSSWNVLWHPYELMFTLLQIQTATPLCRNICRRVIRWSARTCFPCAAS